MKKIFVILACAAILSALCFSAFADVIWEPYKDDFYMNHISECTYLGRNYLCNGESGSVTVYDRPSSEKIVLRCDNGTRFYISFTWTDSAGGVWGVVEHEKVTGWLPMTDLRLVYDSAEFIAGHGGEFAEYKGSLDGYTGKVIFWTYPASGEKAAELEASSDIGFSHVYTDAGGAKWGYVAYHFGIKNLWVCLDNPSSESIAAYPVETEPLIAPAGLGTVVPDNTDTSDNTVLLAGLLVAGVLTATAVIIFTSLKGKNADEDGSGG